MGSAIRRNRRMLAGLDNTPAAQMRYFAPGRNLSPSARSWGGSGTSTLIRDAFSPRTLAGFGNLPPAVGAGITAGAQIGAGAAGGNLSIQQVLMATPSIVGGVLTAGGASSIAAGAWGALAIPIVGAAVAGATIGLTLLFNRKGPKQKQATTAIVNQVEPLLVENRDGYLNGPRTRASQQQAISNFYAGWQWILDHCGIPEMGEPGQRCIAERQEGGAAPWCPTQTGCDWFKLYLDPIRYDDQVRPDTVTSVVNTAAGAPLIQTSPEGGFSQTTVAGIPAPLLAVAGLALVAFGIGGNK